MDNLLVMALRWFWLVVMLIHSSSSVRSLLTETVNVVAVHTMCAWILKHQWGCYLICKPHIIIPAVFISVYGTHFQIQGLLAPTQKLSVFHSFMWSTRFYFDLGAFLSIFDLNWWVWTKSSRCEKPSYMQLIKHVQHPVWRITGTGFEQKPVENCGLCDPII